MLIKGNDQLYSLVPENNGLYLYMNDVKMGKIIRMSFEKTYVTIAVSNGKRDEILTIKNPVYME